MGNTDQRVKDGRHVTPAFLLAALLWPALQTRADNLIRGGEAATQAIHSAGQQVIAETCQKMAIPKRFSYPVREIWELQTRLERKQPKRVKDLIADRRFRAAYDLLLLREESSEALDNAGKFWEQQQLEHPELVGTAPPRTEARPPRRRRPRRKKED
jgi:poly(A) polymerase